MKRTIKNIIQEDIYYIWDNEINGLEKARDQLKKMYFKYFNVLEDTEDKRLILHDLVTVEITIGTAESMESAKFYSKVLKDMLDNIPNYKNTQENKQKYCKALNNYTECHKKEMSKEELINVYEFCYETYKRCDINNEIGYLEKLIAELNINLLNQNFNIVLDIIEDILYNNKNSQYQEALQKLIVEVKNIDNLLHGQVLLLIQKCKNKTV